MKVGRLTPLLGVVLVLLVGGLTALAYASPPDPTWIHGFYDDGDSDDVIFLITFGSDASVPVLSADVDLIPTVDPLATPTPQSLVARAVLPLQSRAPPALSLPR
jgi:hypothetical protein